MAAAPPFSSFSSLDEAQVPMASWPPLYASLQALKGHVQEYPGCQRFDVFVHADGDAGMTVHCYTTWDSPAQLDAYLARGYTFARMLGELDIEISRSLVMEKLF